jgi:hypothetical protein
MLEPQQRASNNDTSDNNQLRIGLNRWLQIFITQSFYIFLVRPTSMPFNNDEHSVPAQSPQAMTERSLAGLVTFYKKLPQRHKPDRPTWYASIDGQTDITE